MKVSNCKKFIPLMSLVCCTAIYFMISKQNINWKSKSGMEMNNAVGITSNNFEERFNARRTRLLVSCRHENTAYEWDNEVQFIADPLHKVVVCAVQKAGSRNWHRAIWESRETDPFEGGDDRMENYRLAKMLSDAIKLELIVDNRTTRAINVRHPFARLVSGWKQKFCGAPFVEDRTLYMSMKSYEIYSKRYPLHEDKCISFQGFADYLLETDQMLINPHFLPVETLCHPCSFPFDYIVKAETAPQDSDFVTEKFGSKLKKFHSSSLQTEVDSSTSMEDRMNIWKYNQQKVADVFEDLPRETVKQLMEMFKHDFERFGYSFDMKTNLPSFVE